MKILPYLINNVNNRFHTFNRNIERLKSITIYFTNSNTLIVILKKSHHQRIKNLSIRTQGITIHPSFENFDLRLQFLQKYD